jgi:Fe-S-cluster containining protein
MSASDLISIEQVVAAFTEGIDQSPCNGCDACGMRCTSGVPMLETEYEAIEAELGALPAEEVAHVLGQEKRQPIPGTEELYTACRFRDVERGRCLIYRARPTICRLFGHVEWLPCPIFKIAQPVPGGVALMQTYSGAPRHTYEAWAERRAAREEGDGR